MKEMKECFDTLIGVITGLQDVIKQHNKMFLDLYERVAELERKEKGGV